jgi:hypothetical protein
MKEQDLKAEIVPKCILAVGEWGTDMVELCVQQEVSALEAVLQYRTQAKGSVARCTERWKRAGWTEVKACVEHDIEATAALADYSKEHEELVARCRGQEGHLGPGAVKACVDKALGLEPADE